MLDLRPAQLELLKSIAFELSQISGVAYASCVYLLQAGSLCHFEVAFPSGGTPMSHRAIRHRTRDTLPCDPARSQHIWEAESLKK